MGASEVEEVELFFVCVVVGWVLTVEAVAEGFSASNEPEYTADESSVKGMKVSTLS